MAEILEAIRLSDGVAALARWRARRNGAPTYKRLADVVERRRAPRRQARLAWGKALDDADHFLCECLVADRTKGGARLRLARNVSLPPRFQFFDDASGALYCAQIVWRRGFEIGCRLAVQSTRNKLQVERRMRSRYYAL